VTSLLKLLLVVAAYLAHGGLWAFALAWVSSQVFGNVLLFGLGVRELAKRRLVTRSTQTVAGTFRRHPDLARFFVFTNLNATARTLRDLDIPVLGWLLGPSATAGFKIARQLAGALNKVIDPFFVAVYPDLARLHSTGNTSAALSLVRRSGLSLGAMATAGLMAFLIVGEPLMVLVLGEAFRSAYPVTAWCVAGAVIWAFVQPVQPMLMVYGRQSALFGINIATTLVYLAAVAGAAVSFGVTGVGATFAAYMLLWAFLTAQLLMRTAAQQPVPLEPTTRAQDA
jgi:O-antigen/teichoic acid export membrane protein